jgi:hypothetical protein
MTVKSRFNTRQLPNDCGLLWPPHQSLMPSRRTGWRTVTCHPLSFRRPVRQAPPRPLRRSEPWCWRADRRDLPQLAALSGRMLSSADPSRSFSISRS